MKRFLPDTNVLRHALQGDSALDTKTLLRGCSRIRVPQIAVLELIEDLYTCRPNKFCDRRAELKLVYRLADHGRLLPAPGEFVAKRVFKTAFANPVVSRKAVASWARIASAYPSKDEFGQPVGIPGLSTRKVDYGLRLDMVAEALRRMRDAHIATIDRYREALLIDVFGMSGAIPRETQFNRADAERLNEYFDSQAWKRTDLRITAETVGGSITEQQADGLHHLFAPASEYLATILGQALTQGYKYWRKGNDVADYNLLLYLADPDLALVTDDAKLRSKLRSDAARARLISSDELARSLRTR